MRVAGTLGAVPMDSPDRERLRRAFVFEREFVRRQATREVPVPGGIAVLNDDHPASFEHNRLIIDGAAEPAELLAAADEVLGGAGREHREIVMDRQFPDEDAELTVASPMARAGYFHLTQLVMALTGAPDRPPLEHLHAAEVDAGTLRPAALRFLNHTMPGGIGGRNERLVERRTLRLRGADPERDGRVTFLAVSGPEGPRSWCDLYRERDRPDGGIAQIEDVVTDPAWRNRGYARAVIQAAIDRARESGCDLIFLRAEQDDWPQELYRRLGFAEIGKVHVFQRLPERARGPWVTGANR